MINYSIKELTEGIKQDDYIISMTGGVDSTYLLLKAVEDVKSKGKGNILCIYHESFYINEKKKKKEVEAIQNILNEIKEEYGIVVNWIAHSIEITNSDSPIINNTMDYLLPQSILWNGVYLTLMPQIGMVNANLQFGFNLSDNITAYSMCIIKNNLETSYQMMLFGNGELNVTAPLLYHSKNQIYDIMIKKYYKYFKMSWSCELPIEKNGVITECCNCEPCKTKGETLKRILGKHLDLNELYKELDKNIKDKEYEQLSFEALQDKLQ